MASDPQKPDLATILKTLASLPRPNAQRIPTGGVQDPQVLQFGASESAQTIHLPQQQWNPPTEPRFSPTQALDPTTIIHWPHGLRSVMRTTAKNENILSEIRRVSFLVNTKQSYIWLTLFKLIKIQSEHEDQWFRARQDLVRKQKVRGEGQKKLDDVLFVLLTYYVRVETITDRP